MSGFLSRQDAAFQLGVQLFLVIQTTLVVVVLEPVKIERDEPPVRLRNKYQHIFIQMEEHHIF